VTLLLRQARGGDRSAAEALARRLYEPGGYAEQLVRRVRGRDGLRGQAEDVVQNTLQSFFGRLAAGKVPALPSRDDLWRLLQARTRDKEVDAVRFELRQKRDGSRTRPLPEQEADGLPAPPADPGQAVEGADLLEWLLGSLPEYLRAAAELDLEGNSNPQIALALGVSEATVERRLGTVRREWRKLLAPLFEGWENAEPPRPE
jgi:DNA-directed RNA polymerase specialized sigma24 family protein